MKNLIIIMVMLLGSVTNAQTFDFECAALTPFQSELNDLYEAAAPPTGFVSGGEIETEALAQGGSSPSVIETFMQKLLPENFSILPIYTNIPVNVTVMKGQNNKIVASPYINITVGNHTGPQIRDWALDVVQAIWDLEHPNYVSPAELRAERIAELDALDKDGVTVDQNNQAQDGFLVDGSAYIYASDYGAYTFEGLTPDQYTAYKNGLITYRDEFIIAALRPTRITELEDLTLGNIVVEHGNSDGSDAFTVSGGAGHPKTFVIETLYGPEKVENLGDNDYISLKDAIQAKIDELNPLSDYSLGLELDRFYDRENIPTFNFDNYGGKLSEISADLATAADIAFDAGLAAQETFIKFLANGATFRGGDSYVQWDSTDSYYHIVTSNVGEGNGYFDIRLDDNNHYLNTNINPTLAKSNFKHLAWHVMSNLWHLAGTTDEELVAFREAQLTAYADLNPNKGCTDGCDWRARKHTNTDGIDRYIPQFESFGWFDVPGSGYITIAAHQGGITTIDELSLANWVSFYNAWKEQIDRLT